MKKVMIASIVVLGLSSCIQAVGPVVTPAIVAQPTIKTQHIDIATGSSVSGGVCKVTYPPDPRMRDLRWMTATDIGSCEDIARDALATFEAQGWACAAAQDEADTDGSMSWECDKNQVATRQ
ncbi:MAG: hypothetical protein AAFO01_02250 [Pseudomonadota bacterium]